MTEKTPALVLRYWNFSLAGFCAIIIVRYECIEPLNLFISEAAAAD